MSSSAAPRRHIQIAIGKLSVHTAAAGIHPRLVIPVVLDVAPATSDCSARTSTSGNGIPGCAASGIQGTAAVVLAALLAAVDITGVDLDEHRVVVFGAGTAGLGIAGLVRDTMLRTGRQANAAEAYSRFWPIGINGLDLEDQPELLDF